MTVRAAAAQFATTPAVADNLASCLRLVTAATAEGAELIVLPEFCNHFSVYESQEHCEAVALSLDGPFVADLQAAAAQHRVHLVATPTVLRGPGRVTVTNLLIGPDGTLLATADKSVLMGNENEFLSRADAPGPVTATAIGRIGTYSCMEGVACDTPRSLAVRGAQILTNSLNSFALDEASLHVPVRAAENRVFVVAANKVGPLIPPDRIDAFAAAMALPVDAFDGAGESQIVGPDGSVLAKAPRFGEAVITAELDLELAVGPHRNRRPASYAPLADPAPGRSRPQGADTITVATSPAGDADLRVLAPALAPDSVDDGSFVVSMDDGQGVLTGSSGEVGRQIPIHDPDGTGASELATFDLPWGRLAMVIGADVGHPEMFRLAAIAGCHVVAVVAQNLPAWQFDLGLPERAAENRICVVAATPEASMVVDLPPDLSLWQTSRARPYSGTINFPDIVLDTRNDQDRERTSNDPAMIHPSRSHMREVSKGTDLVDGRPADLLHTLAQ